MNTRYAKKEVIGGEKIERYAVGPIPAFAFHLTRYVTDKEMADLIKAGATEDQFKRGSLSNPEDQTVIQYGEWLSDTFMPKLLLNEDQLFSIPDEDIDQWEADDWVIVPWDEQWMVKS
jgi:hypothetical protein